MKFAQLCALSALVAACSSTPTNFAGSYTVAVTSQANQCGLSWWQENNTTSAIPVTFSQDGANATLTVQGLVGAGLSLYIGTNAFQGKVEGDTFTAEYVGSKPATQGTCNYTLNMKVSATLSNSALTGTLTYTPVTNGDPGCGALNLCSNSQIVSGNRTGP